MNPLTLKDFNWDEYNKLIDDVVSKKYFLDYNIEESIEEDLDAFYVSERYKILYIPISKNASTSLKNSIDFKPIYQTPKVSSKFDLELPEKYKKEYKILVITRHPKDRWISGFNEFLCDLNIDLSNHTSKDILLELKNKKFIFDGHTLPQLKYIDYCFELNSTDFEINLIKIDQDINKKLSEFIGEDIKIKSKNLMHKDELKVKNFEFCYKIFTDYCLKHQKFIDVYKQDYTLYQNSI